MILHLPIILIRLAAGQPVNLLLNPFGPLQMCFGIVECFMRDWFPKVKMYFGIFMPHGFIGQEKHFQIPFYPEEFSEVGQPVKTVCITSAYKNRNDVAFRLNGLGNEMFFPFQIHYPAFYFARRQSRGKYQNLCIGTIDFF